MGTTRGIEVKNSQKRAKKGSKTAKNDSRQGQNQAKIGPENRSQNEAKKIRGKTDPKIEQNKVGHQDENKVGTELRK